MNSTTTPPIVRAAQSSTYASSTGLCRSGYECDPPERQTSGTGKLDAVSATGSIKGQRSRSGAGQGCYKTSASSAARRRATWWSSTWTVHAGYPAFAATFPHLAQTYTVATGGGVGKHVYFRVEELPPSVKAMGTPIGNLELCGQGRQVVAPPSVHPDTGQAYRVEKACDILHFNDLDPLVAWIEAFKPRQTIGEWRPPTFVGFPSGDLSLNPRVIDAIAQTLAGQGFKQRGDWLHGSCIHPERHQNGDRNPSFGFNLKSGYAHCYVCGTMLAKEVCETLNIDLDHLGGLVERPQPLNRPVPQFVKSRSMPDKPDDPPTCSTDYALPDWLHTTWIGRGQRATRRR